MLSVFIEVFHDALRLLMRSPVAVIVTAAVVRHDLDALPDKPVKALLKRGVHVRNCRSKAFRIETIVVYRHFPVLCELVLFRFLDVVPAPYCRSRFGFYGARKDAGGAIPDVFSGELLLPGKEEFAGNALQNGGNRHGSLHSHRQNLWRWRHGGRGQETVQTGIKG